MSENIQAPNGD